MVKSSRLGSQLLFKESSKVQGYKIKEHLPLAQTIGVILVSFFFCLLEYYIWKELSG